MLTMTNIDLVMPDAQASVTDGAASVQETPSTPAPAAQSTASKKKKKSKK
jgi:hypothetical protein